MAWALQFDGVNDYATLASVIDFTGDFTVEFELDLTVSRNDGFLELSTSTNNFFGKINNNAIFCRMGGQTLQYNPGASVVGVHKYKWQKTGTTLVASFDNVVQITNSSFTGGSTFDLIGRLQGGNNLLGQLLSITGVDSNSQSFSYDPTASSHAAGTPVLIDTVGGNDATGVNMPTDGSAWIDLGGGGISITADTVNTNYTTINPAITLTGSISINEQLLNVNYSSLSPAIDLTGLVDVVESTVNTNYQVNASLVTLTTGAIEIIESLVNTQYQAKPPSILLTPEPLGIVSTVCFDGVLVGLDYNGTSQDLIYNGQSTSIEFGGDFNDLEFNGTIQTTCNTGSIKTNY
jgi:hypothetical protein